MYVPMTRYNALKTHMNAALKENDRIRYIALYEVITLIDENTEQTEISDAIVNEVLNAYVQFLKTSLEAMPDEPINEQLKIDYDKKLSIILEYA